MAVDDAEIARRDHAAWRRWGLGASLAFGVDSGLAVAAVLGYRAFEYWLSIIPEALSYLRLRRTAEGRERGGDHSKHVMPAHSVRCDNSGVFATVTTALPVDDLYVGARHE